MRGPRARASGISGREIVLLLPGRRPRDFGVGAGTSPASRGLRVGELIPIGTPLRPYEDGRRLYGEELLDEVSRLASVARIVAAEERSTSSTLTTG